MKFPEKFEPIGLPTKAPELPKLPDNMEWVVQALALEGMEGTR